MRRLYGFVALGLAAIVLSGCVVGPNYRRPAASTPPPVFRGQASPEQASLADLPWWEVFQDETLRDLIKTALANSYDLRVAVARVEQARQFARVAHADYLPNVGYLAGVSEGKNESLGNIANSGGKRQATLAAGISATWEADMWGRIRRSNEFALARYLQTEQARRGVLLSLATMVASSYFELLELDLRLEIARRNVARFQQTLGLFEDRLNGGKASRVETSRARAALESTAAAIPELERQIAIQENEIRLLLGSEPGAVARKRALLDQSIPPEIPAGLPSALLERRPDILAAESSVRAANAQIGIATASFFPQIGLTALMGRGSSPLAFVLSGQTNIWSLAATAAGPIYAGGALKARKQAAVAGWQETVAQYEQTVLAAFRDVSNALITREKLEEVRARQIEAVRAFQEAVEVSQERYTAGKSSYFEVLDAQNLLFPAENALARTELDRRLALIALYQALGGGWKLSDGDWNGPKP